MQEHYSDAWNYSPSITVYEEDKAPIPTGIMDHSGHMIYRTPKPFKFGFHPETSKETNQPTA